MVPDLPPGSRRPEVVSVETFWAPVLVLIRGSPRGGVDTEGDTVGFLTLRTVLGGLKTSGPLLEEHKEDGRKEVQEVFVPDQRRQDVG